MRDLAFIGNVAHGNSLTDVFWHFYERLKPEDKALAKSDAGLPLAKYDTVWIADYVNAGVSFDDFIHFSDSGHDELDKEKEAERTKVAFFSDPDFIRTVVLRMQKRRATSWTDLLMSPTGNDHGTIPQDVQRHTYYPVLAGERGKPLELTPLYDAFPVYSPKREQELQEERKRKPSNNAD